MPSECRMPSIFGPTPEISLRSSSLAGFSMPAGRFGSVSDGLRRQPLPAAPVCCDACAGVPAVGWLCAAAVIAASAALFDVGRRRASARSTLAAFSAAGATLTGGRRLQRRAGLGRVGLRLGGLRTAARGSAPAPRRPRQPPAAAPRASRRASISGPPSRRCSVVRPDCGAETMRSFCGPAGTLRPCRPRRHR